MEIINLATRKQVEVLLNGRECVISFSVNNIEHFQNTNKISMNDAVNEMKNGNLSMILKLIYSMVSDKKTGRILGSKFFKEYDEMNIIQALSPTIMELIGEEMPKAKTENEKK